MHGKTKLNRITIISVHGRAKYSCIPNHIYEKTTKLPLIYIINMQRNTKSTISPIISVQVLNKNVTISHHISVRYNQMCHYFPSHQFKEQPNVLFVFIISIKRTTKFLYSALKQCRKTNRFISPQHISATTKRKFH